MFVDVEMCIWNKYKNFVHFVQVNVIREFALVSDFYQCMTKGRCFLTGFNGSRPMVEYTYVWWVVIAPVWIFSNNRFSFWFNSSISFFRGSISSFSSSIRCFSLSMRRSMICIMSARLICWSAWIKSSILARVWKRRHLFKASVAWF